MGSVSGRELKETLRRYFVGFNGVTVDDKKEGVNIKYKTRHHNETELLFFNKRGLSGVGPSSDILPRVVLRTSTMIPFLIVTFKLTRLSLWSCDRSGESHVQIRRSSSFY